MEYAVRDPIFGAKVVSYACPSCAMPLESPLAEAGTSQKCPICGELFVTPGIAELELDRAAEADRQRAAKEHDRMREEERLNAMTDRSFEKTPPTVDLVWYGAMRCDACGYQWQARRNTPPAKCASCSSRNITAVHVPKRADGCTTWMIIGVVSMIAFFIVVAFISNK